MLNNLESVGVIQWPSWHLLFGILLWVGVFFSGGRGRQVYAILFQLHIFTTLSINILLLYFHSVEWYGNDLVHYYQLTSLLRKISSTIFFLIFSCLATLLIDHWINIYLNDIFPTGSPKYSNKSVFLICFFVYSKICALFSGFEQIALYKLTTKRKRWKYNSFTVCHETTTINIYYKWRRLKGCNVLTSDEAFYSYHKKRFWCTVPCFWIVLNLKLIAFFHWNCSKSINELISAQTISIQRNILHWEPFHNYIYIE